MNYLVINYSSPEMNHLAAALAEAHALSSYVRPYTDQHRRWERALSVLPITGKRYQKTFGRRTMPKDFPTRHICEIAVFTDFIRAGLRMMGGGRRIEAWQEGLHWHIQRRIAEMGARRISERQAIVGSYAVSEPAFRCTDGPKILNYPTVHHRFIQKFVAEEAYLEPSFASTLPDWSQSPRWVEPRLDAECELASTILVGSNFARDSFVTEGIPVEKLKVIPYGADLSLFNLPTDRRKGDSRGGKEKFRILYVGSITQRKGISYLLRAYKHFAGSGTRLTLVGSLPTDVSAFTSWRDLFTHVPHVPQKLLPAQYAQADVFAFPALIEGMGLVVLEAMASGLPVITTPNGPGDIVRDGVDGFVVPIRDVNAIVDKLEYLRTHPEQRFQMGKNARKRAHEYSWAVYRKRVLETLLSLGAV